MTGTPHPARDLGNRIRHNVGLVLIGKEQAIDLALIALLCEGHLLAEDVPGTGKTMLIKSLAISTGCSFSRIQFTPDLLPSDVTGVSVFSQKTGEFEFRPGPIVAQFVLADEINRATPRTQSSLLESMEERQITVDGAPRRLPRPFFVFATQNPIEQEGTFPLPEAQLDRFFMKIGLGYPSLDQEDQMLARLQLTHPIDTIGPVTGPEELLEMQQAVRAVHVDDGVRRYVAELARATRHHADVAIGASPRAALAGNRFVVPDDVKAVAPPVLGHRLILKPESELRGRTAARVISEVLAATPAPVEAGGPRSG